MPHDHASPSLPVTVPVPGGSGYAVHFRPLADLPALLAYTGLVRGRCLIVTDSNVAPLYLNGVVTSLERTGWQPETRVVAAGEASKSTDLLGALYDWALGLGVTRETPLFALGGGVVGDLAGFAAATLLRGLPLVHLPTSVIAQVDSAVGGKTGVNHPAGKNLLGAFYPPRLVLTDVATLATLPSRELHSGLAEVVKHALLEGAPAVARLEANWEPILARDPDVLAATVRQAVGFKASVVAADPHETGRRAILNLGHTFGHAIEKAEGYGRFTHGEAVALGMRAALHLSTSVRAGRVWTDSVLPPPFDRAERLVGRIPLPYPLSASTEALTAVMHADKKRSAAGFRFVLLDDLGHPRVTTDVPDGAVDAAWSYLR